MKNENIRFRFIWINKKEIEKKANIRALRVKRFHPFDQNWANRKDVIYWRWLSDVIEYIKDTDTDKLKKTSKVFNMTRLWQEEIINSDNLFEWFDINEDEIIMPIPVGKILYQRLIWKNVWDAKSSFSMSEESATTWQKKKIIEIEEI